MKDKDILDMLGLNDRTITLTADDEYSRVLHLDFVQSLINTG